MKTTNISRLGISPGHSVPFSMLRRPLFWTGANARRLMGVGDLVGMHTTDAAATDVLETIRGLV